MVDKFKRLLRSEQTFIILLLILTGIFFYLRSVNRNLYGDEITYFYVFEEKGAFCNNADLKEVKTFHDLLESQINHYNAVNGRAIIHTIEQFFSGIAGVELFYVLNTILFMVTIYIFVKMMFNRTNVFRYWLFAIVVFLYLFPQPESLWVSINFSLNYLWPLCFSLLVLYCWNALRTNVTNSKVVLALMPILGFVAGWSHESFAVPLSAVIFIYYCFNFKEFSGKVALLIIPLWIGTALLVFAPGNFVRLQKEAFSGGGVLSYLKQNPLAIKLLPILIVSALILWRKRMIRIREFAKENYLWIGLFVLSLMFVLVLGLRLGRTYIAVELYSLILIIKLIKAVGVKDKRLQRLTRPVCVVITLLFIVHQSFICNASIKEKSNQDKFINQYIESADGVAVYDYTDYGCLLNPYVSRFLIEIGDNPDIKYFKETLELRHTRRAKRLVTITSTDYDFISNYDKYLKEDVGVKYSGPFYAIDGCDYAWALADSVDSKDSFEFNYAPVAFSDEGSLLVKFKRLLIPDSYPSKEIITEINNVDFDSRKFLAIKITPMRSVIDIKYVTSNNK